MTLYAIGDVQGCHDALRRLLDEIRFDPANDRVWFAGDLVNRGPGSLDTLRFVRELGRAATTVLGNHDLHLLAVAAGVTRTKRRDTLDAILQAPDCDELLAWLRERPLAHYEHDYLLVHAGLAPSWDAQKTIALAGEVEQALRGDEAESFFARMYGDRPARWDDWLEGVARLRCIVNYLTRARYCESDGTLCLDAKGVPGTQPVRCMPWYRVPGRKSAGTPVVFGHWSTLGLVDEPDVIALDTGCVWGGQLSAVPLAPRGARTRIACERVATPGAA